MCVFQLRDEFGEGLVVVLGGAGGRHLGQVGEVERVPIEIGYEIEVDEVEFDFGPDFGEPGYFFFNGDVVLEVGLEVGSAPHLFVEVRLGFGKVD